MEMEEYIAKTGFKVGLNSEESVEIREKDIVKFDGSKAEINGSEYNVPKFDSAISAGWVIPLEEYESGKKKSKEKQKAPSAEIELSPADGEGEPTVSDGTVELAEEERVVTKVEDREELRQEGERQREAQKGSQSESKKDAPQDGQVVAGGFKSSTESNTKLEGRNASKQGINRKIKDTRSAVSRKDKVSKNDVELETEAGASTMEDPGDIPRTSSTPAPDQEDQVEMDVEEDDKLDPDTKQGRFETVKAASPDDLPDMDFSQHWASRMKELRENHSDNPAMIRAVYAAESDKIKARIKKEFSEVFEG